MRVTVNVFCIMICFASGHVTYYVPHNKSSENEFCLYKHVIIISIIYIHI